MYDTKYICNYNDDDVILEEDNIDPNDEDFIRNTLYRSDFVSIFGLEDFDDVIINKEIHDLYEKVKDSEELNFCIKEITKSFILNDGETGLMMLFSYDFLYLLHPCICDFLEYGKINDSKIELLKKALQNK